MFRWKTLNGGHFAFKLNAKECMCYTIKTENPFNPKNSTFFYAELHQFIYLNLSATVVLLFFEVKAKIILIKALTLIIVGV